MSQLENALDAIIHVFHQYSTLQPQPDKINQGEFKQLVNKELAEFLKNQVNAPSIEELFKQLDQNPAQEIGFKEFMALITTVTIATHQNLHSE